MMELYANAKINLCLDVVGKREDGYHEMDMIMIPLTLHDTIWLKQADQDTFTCKDDVMVINESNTIVRAVNLMRETFSLSDHYEIHVEKQIPMEAGLAGGSADAAAIMKGIWKQHALPCTLEELAFLGKQIGADVPFCIMNECSLVRGIGEQITPFKNICQFGVLLVKPAQGVSTASAFARLDFGKCEHPDTLLCKDALEHGDFERFCRHSGNTLEYSAFQMVPELLDLKQRLQDMNFPFVLMSGSGSTMFALSQDPTALFQAADILKQEYPFVTVCEPWLGDRLGICIPL